MSKNKIPVSVVIPCFRCKDTIGRAVKSVEQQTVLPVEIILVDDCSEDGTLQLLQDIAARCPKGWVKVVALDRNGGPSDARNAGWGAAGGTHIAFLDADDSWHPRKLELQYGWMHRHPEVVMTGHGTRRLIAEECLSRSVSELTAWPVTELRLLLSNRFPTRSVMIHSNVPLRFCPGKFYSEDYLLWLQVVLNGYPAWYLDAVLAFSYKPDFNGAGLSKNLWLHEKGELATYAKLFREKLIPRWVYYPATAISLLKFVRRVLISAMTRRAV